MKIGVFDHMDRGLVPLDRLYEERLKRVEAYDRAGFHGYHVAEHPATPLGVAPSPGVWLAAVAQRTKRLRFGPLVYLLPLYRPIKLLEEIRMLDQISGGRPDKVRDFLRRTIDDAGLNYLLCRFAFGDITGDEALNSVNLFTRHVMPDITAHRKDA